MQWTVRYYLHEGKIWEELSTDPDILPGVKAYAARHADIWYGRAAVANKEFKSTNSRFTPLQI
jgi:hypothetical protein